MTPRLFSVTLKFSSSLWQYFLFHSLRWTLMRQPYSPAVRHSLSSSLPAWHKCICTPIHMLLLLSWNSVLCVVFQKPLAFVFSSVFNEGLYISTRVVIFFVQWKIIGIKITIISKIRNVYVSWLTTCSARIFYLFLLFITIRFIVMLRGWCVLKCILN